MRTRRLRGIQIISPTATGYLSIVENIYNHNMNTASAAAAAERRWSSPGLK